jgi:hypothetical protein
MGKSVMKNAFVGHAIQHSSLLKKGNKIEDELGSACSMGER